ncbi:MAG: hypothetical protein M3P27_04930 [Acidobacteriota bacterium]|nr:hypothetical protein [Acidobacteriota bacterium]
MKSLLCTLAALLIAAPLACAQSSNEGVSLGDAARAQQAKKSRTSPNAKVYDNENLPKSGAISTTTGDYAGIAAAPTSSKSSGTSAAAASTTSSATAGKDKDKDAKEQTPDEAMKAQADDFSAKVAEAKKNITQLEREVDVMQRENRLKAAAFYGDAGTKLRDGAKYQADDQKQQETLKAKQDELNAAKAALDQVRDDIRKAGLPSSIGE